MTASMLGRRRGVWVPLGEVLAYLACGWELLEEHGNEALLAPPARDREDQEDKEAKEEAAA